MSFDKLILMLESYIKHGRELHDQFLSEIKLYSMFVYHELLIAKFSLKMKKVKKTTRPFRYYLSQIPYDYAVEVTSRVKGLDLIECLKNYGWRFITLYRKQWSKPHQEKEVQQGKMLVWGGLTNSWEKKRHERQRRKGKIYPFECRVP